MKIVCQFYSSWEHCRSYELLLSYAQQLVIVKQINQMMIMFKNPIANSINHILNIENYILMAI